MDKPGDGVIVLRKGALETALSPALGGAILAFSADGADLLRPAPAGATDPLAMASFPLVPYANRIANGRFHFGGVTYHLPLNFGDHPHSIHGFGWQTGWALAEADDAHAHMVHAHDGGGGWPWRYRADQTVTLTESQLSIRLTLVNQSDAAMPAGLGFHPYFAADAATRLHFASQGVWLSGPDMLPQQEAPPDALGDWSRPALAPGDSLIDNAYAGWDGTAIIERGDGTRLIVNASGATGLHVYRPPDAAFFCLEPVTHMPDAVNRGGMGVLQPGQSMTLSMTINVDKQDRALPNSARIA